MSTCSKLRCLWLRTVVCLVAVPLSPVASRIASAGVVERARPEGQRERLNPEWRLNETIDPAKRRQLEEALKRTYKTFGLSQDSENEKLRRECERAAVSYQAIMDLDKTVHEMSRNSLSPDEMLSPKHLLAPRPSGVQSLGRALRPTFAQHLYNVVYDDMIKAFGPTECENIVQLLHGRRHTLSKLPTEPVVYVSSTGKDSPNTAESVIRSEGGKWVEHPLDDKELARQRNGIIERLKPLTTERIEYLVLTAGGEALLIESGRWQPIMHEHDITAWLGEHSDDNLSVILVPETANITPQLQHLKEAFVRSCEEKGKVPVYEDGDPELARRNVNAQKPVRSAKDVAMYADSAIKDAKILTGMETSFKICINPEIVTAGNLIIITGHKDMELKNYLMELSENRVLRGKTVALVSCGESGDREFCQKLIKEGGATCVLRMNQTIDSAAARNVLLKMADTLEHLPDKGLHLDQLWKQAADAAEEEAVSDLDKEKLRALRDCTKQVSLLFQSERTTMYG